MSEGIFSEVTIFFQSFSAGVIVILAYDILRVLRRIIRHSTLAVAFQDLLYWIGCGFFLFRILFLINDGVIRWYSILGITMGMLLYNFTLSTLLVNTTANGLNKILHVVKKTISFISKPFRWIFGKISAVFGFLFGKVRKITKYLKKRLKKMYKEVKMLISKH